MVLDDRYWYLWWIEFQRAVNACTNAWENDSGVAFEALSPSVYEWYDGAGVQHSIFIAQKRQLTTHMYISSLAICYL